MNKRPFSITIIAWIFIAVGIVGLIYHSTHPNEEHMVWILFLRVLALVCGVCMLLRQDWARWLAAAWLAYHVYLSLGHEASKLIVHALLFVTISVFLFRHSSTAYFRGKDDPPSPPSPDPVGPRAG
jgi:uncharacterized membrane protein HdeD (DUF308 family)